jgi:hypothetical protein
VVATPACPVHLVGKRIVDRDGHTVYRSPGHRVEAAQVKCSGRTVWVLFHGGGASSQEAYVGVRSGDGGRTWKLVLSEPYFGVRAPFTIDSYSGPWTIVGENAAYFVGWCPACGDGTVSLTVTLDGGTHFRRYRIPELTGFRGTGIRVVGDDVTITARSNLRTGPRRRRFTREVTPLRTAKLGPPGRPGCRPPSPALPFGGNRNAPEVKGTAKNVSLWALSFLPERASWIDPRVLRLDGVRGKQLKIVWRMTGRGRFRLLATGPGGLRVRPFWGPQRHVSSTWTRPGDEWGSGFVLPKKGCWRLRATRGASHGDVWLVVSG